MAESSNCLSENPELLSTTQDPVRIGYSTLEFLESISTRLSYANDQYATRLGQAGTDPKGAADGDGRAKLLPGYELQGEIAHGGMGAIIKARDFRLGREVAVKVLLDRLLNRPEIVQRFIEEAQVGGQLQHPGIVPVYELGQFPDRRPYFAMKLVKGQTLAVMLRDRADPSQGLPRFLKIFEQICQTMAYAHSRCVIHRDLKPLNVMVGSFGEVQVMDWGLAKVFGEPGESLSSPARDKASENVVRTVRSDSPDWASQAGAVLGTYSYMAPEQARGETANLDERCDVFGLGAILCEILTGSPPYSSQRGDVRLQGSRSDLTETMALLDTCQVDQELRRLARICLSVSREDRPRDAGEVARQITAYLTSVQERLQKSEIDRAAAEARVEEARAKAKAERKARRLTAGLAALLVALVLMAGGFAWWLNQRWSGTEQALDETKRQLEGRHWAKARETLERAQGLVTFGKPALQQSIAELRDDLEWIDQIEEIRLEVTSVKSGSFDRSLASPQYESSFHDHGIDVWQLETDEAAKQINRRTIRLELQDALNNWIYIAREPKTKVRLLEIVQKADPDPDSLTHQLRKAWVKRDKGTLLDLTSGEALSPMHQGAFMLTSRILMDLGEPEQAIALLRQGQRQHPDDFWANHDLGYALMMASPPKWDEAIQFHTAAVALRSNSPGAYNNLALALRAKGQLQESVLALQKALSLKADYSEASCNLGLNWTDLKQPEKAIDSFRKAIDLKHDDGKPWLGLGQVLVSTNHFQEGQETFGRGVALKAADAEDWYNLGVTYHQFGRDSEAVSAYEKAIELNPKHDHALGNLAVVLGRLGRTDDAIAASRKAIAINGNHAKAHYNLGNELMAKGLLQEAAHAYQRAIKLNLNNPEAYNNLAGVLADLGQQGTALAAYRQALVCKDDHVSAYYGLAGILEQKGQIKEAENAYRKATELQPDFAEAFCNWGQLLKRNGRFAEALIKLKRGHEIGTRRPNWRNPSPRWLKEAESYLGLEQRLPAILEGQDKPKNSAELMLLIQLYVYKRQYAASVKLYEEAFAEQPKLLDLKTGLRYNAACAAALAGCGRSDASEKLDDAQRVRFRKQGLAWLRADMEERIKKMETSPPEARIGWQRSFSIWKKDRDLEFVRNTITLQLLPESERREWEKLWHEVAISMKSTTKD